VTARYNGDSNFAGSRSATLTQKVTRATITTLRSTSRGGKETFTATVASRGASTPTGTVTFLVNGTARGSGTLSGGKASLTLSALAPGSYVIVAQYRGTSAFGPSRGVIPLVVGKATLSAHQKTPSIVPGTPFEIDVRTTSSQQRASATPGQAHLVLFSAPPQGTLTGALTASFAPTRGLATFTGLKVNRKGTYVVIVQDDFTGGETLLSFTVS
jgi:hypothetical protein